jgi:uncharacterized protein YbcC (UPF0753/DUF2309 family)
MTLATIDNIPQQNPPREQTETLIALAARTVAPLWPLESPIAVNPLAGFEDMPFFDAVAAASALFGARGMLPVVLWRRLLEQGRVDPGILAEVAIERVGGLGPAFEDVIGGITAHDMMMARLLELPIDETPSRRPAASQAELLVAKWLAAYLDQGVSTVEMPGREQGLYAAVRSLIVRDPDFVGLAGRRGAEICAASPTDPVEAVARRLASFDGDQAGKLALLQELVARLPGWAGHIRWRSEFADPAQTAGAPAGMADYLALWMLVLDFDQAAPVADPLPQPASPDLAAHFKLPHDAFANLEGASGRRAAYVRDLTPDQLSQIFMEAAERTLQAKLVAQVRKAARQAKPAQTQAKAQLLFCIDVRSEPLRRQIEAQGAYETLGYAGFFGLPVAFRGPADSVARPQLPVLLQPRHEVSQGTGHASDKAMIDRFGRSNAAASLLDRTKQTMATSFALAEAAGPIAGLMMALRNVAPGLAHKLAGPQRNELAAQLTPCLGKDHVALPLEDRVAYANSMFQLTGLKAAALAQLVLLVGHGATTTNNPYGGALECGACGGRAGGPNARMMAAILNDPHVRAGLAARGHAIPEATWFVAAQHDTTTDHVALFDCDTVPACHRDAIGKLARDLSQASVHAREQRAVRMERTPKDLLAGALHWGEVRPEWGLSGNGAFIVGPRDLTHGTDLEGHCFLHSYDWETDTDGSALKGILCAPMVVTQWINGQYLFSTIDNDVYGAGDKTVHNIVGGFGVLRGNEGDLCVGLPRQSLFMDDGTPFHVPRRLLTIVHAPLSRVDELVHAEPLLMRLFGNGWVHLVVVEPGTGHAYRWRAPEEVQAVNHDPAPWGNARTAV